MSEANKIVPIGGVHKTARSLLAEVMNDPELDQCVVITFSKEGGYGRAQHGMSRERMAFAAALIQRWAFEEWDE